MNTNEKSFQPWFQATHDPDKCLGILIDPYTGIECTVHPASRWNLIYIKSGDGRVSRFDYIKKYWFIGGAAANGQTLVCLKKKGDKYVKDTKPVKKGEERIY